MTEEEVIKETTKGLEKKRGTKPVVQEFPFSSESRIAELEKEVTTLKQIVKELQVRIGELERPLSEVLEELGKELGEELRKENKLPH